MQREEQVQKPGGHSGVSAFKMEDVFWDWEEKAGLMVGCTMFLVGGGSMWGLMGVAETVEEGARFVFGAKEST